MSVVLYVAVVPLGCGGEPTAPGPGGEPTLLASLSDEFDDVASLGAWSVRAAFEGGDSDGAADIEGGQLVLRPVQDRYFLNEHRGLSLFKPIVTADHPNFLIETRVQAVDRATRGAPVETFHSAGLVVYPDVSRMTDWVVTNIGLQGGALGFEDKNTVANQSVLTLYPTGTVNVGMVRLCVVGNRVTAFTRLDGDAGWTERNGFTHDVGTTLGAGVMINDYQSGVAEVDGLFDYVRYRDIEGAADCTS